MPSPRHSTSDKSDKEEEVTSDAKTEKDDAPYYCPGCGKRVQYPQQCTGRPEAPHPPIEVVSTEELSGDPEKLTAAPSTENLG